MQTLPRYELAPRFACGVVALIMTALTMGVLVGLPFSKEAPDMQCAANPTTANHGASSLASTR